jgi:hypothetical protein
VSGLLQRADALSCPCCDALLACASHALEPPPPLPGARFSTGIAKFKDRTFVSTVGAQAGTPAYMAPEMFDGAPVSEKVGGHSR